MTDKNGIEMARKTALFRFALIAPVIQGTYTDTSAIAYYRRITEKPLVRPDGTSFLYAPKTLSKWADVYKENGLDGLTPKIRSDKGSTRIISNECISEIYQIKEKFPKLNAAQIHQRLLQLELITTSVSVRTIQRFVKNHNLKNGTTTGMIKDRKAFEEEFFGSMWMADTCYFPYITERGKSRRTYLIAIIDDHSRLIVGARLFYEDNAINFQKLLKDAISTYGIPTKLYLDNGSPYRNSQLSFICAEVGTVLIHTPVRDGPAKAKIERFFLTIKERFLYGFDVNTLTSLEEFNHELNNHIRVHNLTVNSSTRSTPMDRYLASMDHIRTPKSREWIDLCFMNRVSRRVRNDATVSIDNTYFDVPIQFIKQYVEIRYLPDRIEDAYIYESGSKYPIKITNKVANAKTKRDKYPTIDYSKGVSTNV